MEQDKHVTIDSIKIPLLGFGTWKIGGLREPDHSKDGLYIKIIKEAINLGMTHIDTAEMYGGGHAEEIIGEAIKMFDRKKLFITSKVWHNHLKYDDLINSCKLSLKRLSITYLDLYLIHWPNPNVDMKETMRAMDFLVEKGLVRHIGLSNFNAEQIREAQMHTKNRIFALQTEFNLLVRNRGKFTTDMESKTIPYCKEQGIQVIAWRPLAEGVLAKPGITTLDEIAAKYRKTQSQVALNWLYCKGIITLVKCSSVEHLKDNLGSLGWKLDRKDIIALDNLKEKDKLYKEVLPTPD